ncbi:MAG: hypothetical protein K0Q66_1308 [Chitinophagaceae bacterium]|nr:hypothetical protein [Chitinophagaceae bacterium]
MLLIGSTASAQTVAGKWYGVGNASFDGMNNNYLVELTLEQKGSSITGEFNYYFKNSYFPNKISGSYDSKSRRLYIKTTPVTYFRSSAVNGVECAMNGEFTLLVSKAGASLKGKFSSTSFYALTCPDIIMNLNPDKEDEPEEEEMIEQERTIEKKEEKKLDAPIPVTPIVFKEQTIAEKQFPQRENVDMGVIELDSSNITIQIVDNGEIDRDSVSLFFNTRLLAEKLELTKRGLVYNVTLDDKRPMNEVSMFAENLGFIPPNTAVLIIYDGRKKHEVSLTSTLQTNGTIRLRKKAAPVATTTQ